jgi:WD40 repeat protein
VVSSGAEWASLDAETGLPACEPVAFSPVRTTPTVSADGGTVVVWARDAGASVYDARLGGVRGTVAAGLKGSFVYAVSPDGTLAAAGHWTSGPPDEIRVWRTDDGSEAARLRIDSPVRAIAFSPDNRRLAAVMDRTKRQHEVRIGVWDLTDRGVRRLTISTDRIVQALAFSPDGRRLAAGDEAGRVMLWDAGSGALLTGLGGEWVRPMRTLTWSPDGRIIAGGAADGRVHLWWPDAAGDTTALHCGKSSVTSLAFSPDGRTLAVGLVKGPVTLWEVPGHRER